MATFVESILKCITYNFSNIVFKYSDDNKRFYNLSNTTYGHCLMRFNIHDL